MTQYKDLDLKKIREAADLDFAHYTYQKHMCSCCYGPKDLPKLYWKNRTIPDHYNYSYILFKNASNGGGAVTKNDTIKHHTCISWKNMTAEQLDMVCQMLLDQLDSDYAIAKPKCETLCIIILRRAEMEQFMERNEKDLKENPEFAYEILIKEEPFSV